VFGGGAWVSRPGVKPCFGRRSVSLRRESLA